MEDMIYYMTICTFVICVIMLTFWLISMVSFIKETKQEEKNRKGLIYCKEEIENIIKALNAHIEQDKIRYASLDKRLKNLEPKAMAVHRSPNDDYVLTTASYVSKENVEKMINEKVKNNDAELVDYKAQNELLKKEIEEYKRLSRNKDEAFRKAYSELLQEKIDRRDWEYLGGKKK